jgi:hypothetical protein
LEHQVVQAGGREGEQMAGAAKPKVVYVLGAGRSGSTILGITLGNCADCCYAGELNLWIGKDGRSPLPGSERAQFWSSVRQGVTDDLSGLDVGKLEKSLALDVRGRRAGLQSRGRYLRVTEDLYRAIARVAGVSHVIDSSHFPRRARELQRLDGIDLYLLFLVRDPQDIVASYSRDDAIFPRFNIFNTNLYLWLTYSLALSVFLRHPRERRLFVRYEAFMADPAGVLEDILRSIDSAAAVPDFTAMKTGVAFQGNQILKSEVIALEQRPSLRSRGWRLAMLLNLPWRFVFSRLRPVTRGS